MGGHVPRKKRMDLCYIQQSYHKLFPCLLLAIDTEFLEGRGHVSFITGNVIPNATMHLAVPKHSGSSCSLKSDP